MERESWDTMDRQEAVRSDMPVGSDPFILVNGSSVRLNAGASFVDTVKAVSKDAGFGKFRVFLNSAEIKPSQAPEFINEGDRLEICPYDVAGR